MQKKLYRTIVLTSLVIMGLKAYAEFYNPNAGYIPDANQQNQQQAQSYQQTTPMTAAAYVVATPTAYAQGTYGYYYQQKYGGGSYTQTTQATQNTYQQNYGTNASTQYNNYQPTQVIVPYYPNGATQTNYSNNTYPTNYNQNAANNYSSDTSTDAINNTLNTVNSTINLINTFKNGW